MLYPRTILGKEKHILKTWSPETKPWEETKMKNQVLSKGQKVESTCETGQKWAIGD